jgi:hypothetical protein
MFSFDKISQRQYVYVVQPIAPQVVTNIGNDGSNGDGVLPAIPVASPNSTQINVSQHIQVTSNFSLYTTAQDVINGTGTPDLGIVYSSGYRLSYVDGLKNLADNPCVIDQRNGRRIVTSYVGNAVVPIKTPEDIKSCSPRVTTNLLGEVIISPCNK